MQYSLPKKYENLIFLSFIYFQSLVDSKKLQKAEAKLAQKQEKRDQYGVNNRSSSSSTLTSGQGQGSTGGVGQGQPQECAASAAQVISKKDAKASQNPSASGKITDIKIENFDVAFGDK